MGNVPVGYSVTSGLIFTPSFCGDILELYLHTLLLSCHRLLSYKLISIRVWPATVKVSVWS